VADVLLRSRGSGRGSRRSRRHPRSQQRPNSDPGGQAQHLAPSTDFPHALSKRAPCRRCGLKECESASASSLRIAPRNRRLIDALGSHDAGSGLDGNGDDDSEQEF
jgi:hypothetical protein